MSCDHFELPNLKRVAKACKQFDIDNKIIEGALTDLFAKYPTNKSEAQVLLKVITLNLLYATQIPTLDPDRPNVFDVAQCIPGLDVDKALKECSLQIVNTISTTQFQGKRKINRFAFATKYASWHRPDVYPIWDRNVQNYLTCLRKLHRTEWDKFADGFPLSSNDWGYPEFHELMTRFRDHYGLRSFTFKEIDKFLWTHGAKRSSKAAAQT